MIRVPTSNLFLNRELSLIEFNKRVLAQAENRETPLLERLKFLSIVSSNLDEFFEIRVAGLKEQIKLGSLIRTPSGMESEEVFKIVSEKTHELVKKQYQLLNHEILPELAGEGINFLRRTDWSGAQQEWVKAFFFRDLMPVLTPIGLDPAHPFPRVLNKSLNFVVQLSGKDAFGRASGMAIVQAPRVLPRVILLPREISAGGYDFIFLSSVLHSHVDELFSGMNVLGCYQFRVTRNSDLFVDEEEVKNLRVALQIELPHRHFGDAVRLEVSDRCPPHIASFLLNQFGLTPEDFYQVEGPVNLVRMIGVSDQIERSDLKYPLFIPGLPAISQKNRGDDIFQMMRKSDILLHHPYQSFQPVVHFIQQAAMDPCVVAIKQTVYRTGTDSVIMESLIDAASKGKEVTVVVELLARFDEEANINWAGRLEGVGAHVVYGVVGHKTHSKMVMIVRREGGSLHRYVHLGTGNYHPRTAGSYTDFGLLTCNEEICADVNEVFTQLTSLGKAGKLKHLWQSPFSFHRETLKAIKNEMQIAKDGRPARIIAKMNSLLEPEVIRALYDASSAGVKIDLIVRGICVLRPGIAGLSENIRVRSVIGRFLEHTRIFYFRSDGSNNMYLSSADWMDRNFFRRIEICFPVLNSRLKKRVLTEGLNPYLRDNRQSLEMDSDGDYHLITARSSKKFCAQEALLTALSIVK